ncbi:MAG: right-handed parallel beta-helix repeat-containing protein [Thermogutta sp.]
MNSAWHRKTPRMIGWTIIFLAIGAGDPGVRAQTEGNVVRAVGNRALRQALREARPGTVIRIASGNYQPEVWVENLHGTEEAPIVIEAEDIAQPPVFTGGSEAWHFSDVSHLVIRGLYCRGQTGNGVNIDDAGTFETPTHHVVIDGLIVEEVGPEGNRDGIKLSGVNDFVVRNCRIRGWGGQAVDMVGCHRGRIEDCEFRGKRGFSQSTGPQAKGGCSEIVIRRCMLIDAGMRAVQLGGSTGLAFFRPQHALFEAKDITVEDCLFVGGDAAVSFVGLDGGNFRHNTIYRPRRWVARILQETREPGFVPSRNGLFEGNLIVFRRDELADFVNVGPYTAPETFRFSRNWWYCEDLPVASRPVLPTAEVAGVYGENPDLLNPGVAVPEEGPAAWARFAPRNAKARAYGVRPTEPADGAK